VKAAIAGGFPAFSLPLPSYWTIRVQLVVACVVPAVGITWKLYVPAGVLFDLEADDEELPPQPNGSKVKPTSAMIIQEARRRFGQSSSRLPAKIPQLNVVMRGPRKGLTMPAMLPAAVETVSIDDWGVPPARVSVAGSKVHEAPAGNPAHVRVTLPV
jgi:hypothetical protein